MTSTNDDANLDVVVGERKEGRERERGRKRHHHAKLQRSKRDDYDGTKQETSIAINLNDHFGVLFESAAEIVELRLTPAEPKIV